MKTASICYLFVASVFHIITFIRGWDDGCLTGIDMSEMESAFELNETLLYDDAAKTCTSYCRLASMNSIKPYDYAFFDNILSCFCGDSPSTSMLAPSLSCETYLHCDLEGSEGCDGEYFTRQYNATYGVDGLTAVIPALIVSGTIFTVTPSVTSGDYPTLMYTYDFGDGTATQTVSGAANFNYASPGIFTLTITADNGKSLPQTFSKRVTVMGKIDASLLYDDMRVIETGVPFNNPLAMFTGSSANVTYFLIDYEGSGPPLSWNYSGPIADTVLHKANIPLSDLQPGDVNEVADYVVFMEEIEMEHDSHIISFDANVAAVGYVSLLITRALCGMKHYCMVDRECSTTCNTTQDLMGVPTGYADFRSSLPYDTDTTPLRTVVAEYIVLLEELGLSTISVHKQDFTLMKGDSIAFLFFESEGQIYFESDPIKGLKYAGTLAQVGYIQPPRAGAVGTRRMLLRPAISAPAFVDPILTFPVHGFANFNATLVNQVNEVSIIRRIPIQARISGTAITHPSVYTTDGYEISQPLSISISTTNGTSITYIYEIMYEGSSVLHQETSSSFQVFSPMTLGHYDLKVTTFNLINDGEAIVKFGVHRKIVSVVIDKPNPSDTKIIVVQNIEYSFNLIIEGGSNITIVVDYGDGSPTEDRFIIDPGSGTHNNYFNHTFSQCARLSFCADVTSFVGTNFQAVCIPLEVACPITNPKLISNPPISLDNTMYISTSIVATFIITMDFGSFVTYEFTWASGDVETVSHINEVFPDTVAFSRRMDNEESLNISMYAYNSISTFEKNFTLVVEQCSVQQIAISSSYIEESPAEMSHSQSYDILVSNVPGSNVDCPPHGCVYDHWKFYKAHMNKTFHYLKTVSETKVVPSLKVTAKSLDDGLYRVDLRQTCGARITDHPSFIEIFKAPLVCQISGGIKRKTPFNTTASDGSPTPATVKIDGSSSYDADTGYVNSTDLILSFFCRRVSNPADFAAAQAARALLPQFAYDGQTCNHTDPRPFPSGQDLTPSSLDTITIEASMFLADIEYEFIIFGASDNRLCNFTQKVIFTAGNVPDASLRAVSNLQPKVNQMDRLIMEASCSNCAFKEVEHEWQLLDKYYVPDPLNNNQSDEVTATKWDKPSFILKANILAEKKKYIFTYRIRFVGENVWAEFEIYIETSELPRQGKVEFSPTSAEIFNQDFLLRFEQWQTVDKPILYEVRLDNGQCTADPGSTSSSTNCRVIYHGTAPMSPISGLPLGTARLCFRIINIAKAYVEFCSMDVTINAATFPDIPSPPAVTFANEAPSNVTESNPILDMMNSYKPDSSEAGPIADWITSCSTSLEDFAVPANFSMESTDSDVPTGSIGLPDTSGDTMAAKKESNTEIRSSLIAAVQDVEVKDIYECKRLMQAIVAATSVPTEITPDSEMIAANAVLSMLDQVNGKLTGTEGADELAQLTDVALKALSQVAGALDINIDASQQESMMDPTGNNTAYAKQLEHSVEVTKQIQKAVDGLEVLLSSTMVVGGDPTEFSTDLIKLEMLKLNPEDVANSTLDCADGTTFQIPPAIQSIMDSVTGPVLAKMSTMESNTMAGDVTSASETCSPFSSLELKDGNGDVIPVPHLTEPIIITIANKADKLSKLKIPVFFPGDVNVTQEHIADPEQPLLLSFDAMDDFPENFTCYLQYGIAPTDAEHDIKVNMLSVGFMTENAINNPQPQPIAPSTDGSYFVIDNNTFIISNFSLMKYGNMTNTSLFISCSYEGGVPPPLYIENEFFEDKIEERRPCTMTVTFSKLSCRYFDTATSSFSSAGMMIMPEGSTTHHTACGSTHLTGFGGFQVAPEPIPALSLDMLKNGFVLLLTVLIILLLYFIALVYAHKSDKKDLKKVGVCPLPDNNPAHHFRYEMTVFTGMRKNAGTESKVFFLVSGEHGESKVRHLEDPHRKILQRNGADSFVFTNEIDLGELSHMRIWHDNSDGGWYLRNIIITDLQKEKSFNFLCSRWLSVADDDGEVERLLAVSGPEELSDFNYIFTTKTRQDLSDAHLWFSIYARPPRSNFTRKQRLSCCLSLLMTTMMASAMFYRVMPKPDPATENDVNGIKFSWAQVFVSVITTLITVPVNVIIVFIFRSARRKGEKKGDASSSPGRPKAEKSDEESVAVAVDEEGNIEVAKKKEPFSLPHWTTYIAWVLVFISVVSSAVMVTIYGMIFGNKTSLDWLASIMLSFFQDVIITQPIKVFMLALFVAAVLKKIEDLDAKSFQSRNKKLASDEQWLHGSSDPDRVGVELDLHSVRPPDQAKLAQMRELRLKERKMFGITKEIFSYTVFVIIAFSISYSLREAIAYGQTEDLNELFRIKHKDVDDPSYTRFRQVYSYNDFWTWMDDVLLPVLFPNPWYNNIGASQQTESFPGKVYLGDINSKLVNGVRLRQIRIKPDSCKKTSYAAEVIQVDCADSYTVLQEQKSDYYFNWSKPAAFENPVSRRDSPWRYQDWLALDGYPFWGELHTYFGGGYAVELFPKFRNRQIINNLKTLQWLDRHSRALFVEFSVFNGATNHFTMVTILFEFPPTGGVVHYASVLTFKLYRYTSGFAFFTITCEILFVFFIIYFGYREAKMIKKQRSSYFKEFWNLIEFSIVALSVVAGGFYGYRSILATQLLQKLPEKKPDRFINFQFAANWDLVFIYIIALIVFFVTIKFIKLLRFNRRVSMLQCTLNYALKPLGLFCIVLGIVVYGTCLFTNLVFGQALEGYSNLFKTTASQLSLLLGKFSYSEYEQTNRVLGPLFFLLYNIVVNWILVNMLISIVNDAFEVVCSDVKEQSNDYEMVDFMLDRFKRFVGVGAIKKDELVEDINWKRSNAVGDVLDAFEVDGGMEKKKLGSVTSLEFYASLNRKSSDVDDVDADEISRSKRWRNAETTFLSSEKDVEAEKKLEESITQFISCIDVLYVPAEPATQ